MDMFRSFGPPRALPEQVLARFRKRADDFLLQKGAAIAGDDGEDTAGGYRADDVALLHDPMVSADLRATIQSVALRLANGREPARETIAWARDAIATLAERDTRFARLFRLMRLPRAESVGSDGDAAFPAFPGTSAPWSTRTSPQEWQDATEAKFAQNPLRKFYDVGGQASDAGRYADIQKLYSDRVPGSLRRAVIAMKNKLAEQRGPARQFMKAGREYQQLWRHVATLAPVIGGDNVAALQRLLS